MVGISVYLDTNVVAALLIPEPLSDRAERYLGDCPDALLVSNLTTAEFSSIVARRVRNREFTADQARVALANFDLWIDLSTRRTDTSAADLNAANALLRRLDLPLRTLDALHIAVAQRINATLVTFDRQMATSARALGMAVATP